jgi:hypothetical protein
MKFATVTLLSFGLTVGCIAPVVAEPAAPLPESIPLAQSRSGASTWRSYNSSAGQFAIQFPGQTETRSRALPIAGQSYDWTIFRLKNEAGFYGVAFTDLTPATIDLGASAIVDSIENTLTEEFNWSALNGRGQSIEVQGYPARELIGTRNNELSVLRLILADQRLYVVMTSSQDLVELGKFIESFQVEPWQPYVSETGGFSVNLPLLPSQETESVELGGTALNWTVIESRNFTAPGDSYSVGYTDVSSEDLRDGAEALLERVGGNLIARWEAKTVVEDGRAVSLNGNPGRSFVGTTADGQIVAVRLYLVGDRMYGVGVLSKHVGNISRFLDSFQVQ